MVGYIISEKQSKNKNKDSKKSYNILNNFLKNDIAIFYFYHEIIMHSKKNLKNNYITLNRSSFFNRRR